MNYVVTQETVSENIEQIVRENSGALGFVIKRAVNGGFLAKMARDSYKFCVDPREAAVYTDVADISDACINLEHNLKEDSYLYAITKIGGVKHFKRLVGVMFSQNDNNGSGCMIVA